jgi:hypothetical protein
MKNKKFEFMTFIDEELASKAKINLSLIIDWWHFQDYPFSIHKGTDMDYYRFFTFKIVLCDRNFIWYFRREKLPFRNMIEYKEYRKANAVARSKQD